MPQLAQQLNEQEKGRKIKIAIALLLILVALGIAGWQFMQSHKPAPAAPAPTPITTTDVEQLMTEVNGSFADIDANMVGLESALNDTQGDLSE
jgi:flagellar basal body-associated protein FliL